MSDLEPRVVKVTGVGAVTAHNQALLDAGRKLLLDSLDGTRDFCKFMITTSTAAVPIYLAVLKIVLPDPYRPGVGTGALLLLPVGVFLTAATVACIGYAPVTGDFSLDIPEDVEAMRSSTLRRRTGFGRVALALFLAGALLTAVIAVWALGIPSPDAASATARS